MRAGGTRKHNEQHDRQHLDHQQPTHHREVVQRNETKTQKDKQTGESVTLTGGMHTGVKIRKAIQSDGGA